MGERKTVRVTIFNQTYSLAATDEEGEVESLAHSIDELMTSIAHAGGQCRWESRGGAGVPAHGGPSAVHGAGAYRI